METVCLFVLSIAGLWCQVGAERPEAGFCVKMLTKTICIVSAERLPLWGSYYDPEQGGIHCDGDCSTVATMDREEWMYNTVVACPPGWVDGRTIVIHWGEYQCLDTGGAIHPRYRKYWDWRTQEFVWGWVITVDFMSREPLPWHYLPIFDWRIEE